MTGPRSESLRSESNSAGRLVVEPSGDEQSAERVPALVPGDTAAPLWRLLRVARPVAWRLLLSGLLGAAAFGSAIGLLATSAWLISAASLMPPLATLNVAIVGVRFFGIGRGVFRYAERIAGHDAAFRTLTDLRVAVYSRLETVAPGGLAAYRSGDLLARLVADVDTSMDLYLRVLLPYLSAVIVGAATVALAWWLLPAAGLLLLLALLIGGLLVPWLSAVIGSRAEARVAPEVGVLTAEVVDTLRGSGDLLAFGAADAALARVAAADTRLTAVARRTAITTGLGSALGALAQGAAIVGTLLVGIPAVRSGSLDGVLLAVIVLLPLAAYEAVLVLPAAALTLARVRASARRILEVVDTPDPVPDPVDPLPLPLPLPVVAERAKLLGFANLAETEIGSKPEAGSDVEGAPAAAAEVPRVRVRNLRARWPGQDAWAVDGVDLDVTAGRTVALVGPSGAGKSTVAAVLLRFLAYEGTVTLDGAELAQLAGDDVRTVVGLVGQDAHIFDSTVAENVRLARRDASKDDLRNALDRARLWNWAQTLPRGVDTPVGEHGAQLSGGQRQRLALARALLADRSVLVLDEPTEHLDPEVAGDLTADLLTRTRDRAVLLVTHRLLGLEDVDEIVVLSAGRVAERGTHAQLVAAGGTYAGLYAREQASAVITTLPAVGSMRPQRGAESP